MLYGACFLQAYKNDAILPLYVSFVHDTELWMVMPYMEVRPLCLLHGGAQRERLLVRQLHMQE